MKYLMDAHTLLWSLDNIKKLSLEVKSILQDNNIDKFISTVSLWEIAIKNRIGKLPLPSGLMGIYNEIEKNGLSILSIAPMHIEIFNNLPLHHRDPFDGMIVATAMATKMTVLTCDENILKYDIKWIW